MPAPPGTIKRLSANGRFAEWFQFEDGRRHYLRSDFTIDAATARAWVDEHSDPIPGPWVDADGFPLAPSPEGGIEAPARRPQAPGKPRS